MYYYCVKLTTILYISFYRRVNTAWNLYIYQNNIVQSYERRFLKICVDILND